MKPRTLAPFFVIIAFALAGVSAEEKDKKPPTPIGWSYVSRDFAEAKASPSERKKTALRLRHGALLPTLESKRAAGRMWTRVGAVDPARLTAETAWVESSSLDTFPSSQFPRDSGLLKLIGGAYLEDFTAANMAIVRYLLRQGSGEPALVCFIGSPKFAQARLQVFLRSPAGFALGPSLEFPFSEMQAGISTLEARDLLGDGNECLVTRESFNLGPANSGVNVVIRRLEAGTFKLLWKAPVEFSNLGSFPAQYQTFTPPEKNIGLPGTVTKGDIEFRARGRISEPLWKGKVEVHVLGRDEPVDTINIERLCRWDGTKFAPLQ